MKEKCDAAMIKAIGTICTYDRVPYGLYPQMIAAQVGWPYIQWSLDTYDWRGKNTAAVLSTVKSEIQDGDIILCFQLRGRRGRERKVYLYKSEMDYQIYKALIGEERRRYLAGY